MRPLLACSLLVVAGLAALLALAAAGWPGTPSRCFTDFVCYCETTASGWIRQPWNTWSNLPTLAVALLVAADAGRLRGAAARLGTLFALVIAWQGLGSMFFHAGLTVWGAMLDATSVFAVVGMLLGANLYRLGALRLGGVVLFLVGMVAAGLLYRALVLPVTAPPVALLFIAVVWTELRRQRTRRQAAWAAASLGAFVAGGLLWGLSLTDALPLCGRLSPLFGHAGWHVCAGVAMGLSWVNVRRDIS